MASIVERHAGSVSREALAKDLTALVNAEREKCAKVAEERGPVCGCSDDIAAKIRASQ